MDFKKCLFSLSFTLVVITACGKGGSFTKNEESSASENGGKSDSPVLVAGDCSQSLLLGTWRALSAPADTMIFNPDCTAKSSNCASDFDFPSSATEFDTHITKTFVQEACPAAGTVHCVVTHQQASPADTEYINFKCDGRTTDRWFYKVVQQ